MITQCEGERESKEFAAWRRRPTVLPRRGALRDDCSARLPWLSPRAPNYRNAHELLRKQLEFPQKSFVSTWIDGNSWTVRFTNWRARTKWHSFTRLHQLRALAKINQIEASVYARIMSVDMTELQRSFCQQLHHSGGKIMHRLIQNPLCTSVGHIYTYVQRMYRQWKQLFYLMKFREAIIKRTFNCMNNMSCLLKRTANNCSALSYT